MLIRGCLRIRVSNEWTNKQSSCSTPIFSWYPKRRFGELLNGVWLADPLRGLRVLRAEILRCWKVQSKGFDVKVELNHHVKLEGFGIAEVPIKYRERLGEKKLGARHGIEIFRRIILEATH